MNYWASSRSDLAASEVTVSADVLSVLLCDLIAWVQYHVEVVAITSKGHGPAAVMDTWTEIASPARPPAPRVNSTGPGTITVIIEPAAAVLSHGPVSAYFIVISTNSAIPPRRRRRRRRLAVSRTLPDPVTFIPLAGVTVAQLSPDDVQLARSFVVGDGQSYGLYNNSALSASKLYTVHYVVASSHDDLTKMNFSSTSSPVSPAASQQDDGLSRDVVVAIAVPLSVLLFILLVIFILLIIYWRCRLNAPSSPRAAGSTLNASWLKYYTGNAYR